MNDSILEGPLGQVLQQIQALEATKSELLAENLDLNARLETWTKAEIGLRAENTALAAKLEISQARAKENDQLKTQLSQSHLQCEALRADLLPLQGQNEKSRDELARYTAANTTLNKKLEASTKKEAAMGAKNAVLIGKLEASDSNTARMETQTRTQLSESGLQCQTLRAEVNALQEKDKDQSHELASCKARIDYLEIELAEVKDAKEDIFSKLEAKEVDLQLMKARLKKAKRKSTESEDAVRAPAKSVVLEENLGKEIEAISRKVASQLGARIEWPGFQVLEVEGNRYYCDMYDGASYNDNSAALRLFVRSLRPSKQIVEILQHQWKVNEICESPESPMCDSEDTPAFTSSNSPDDDVFKSPATPQAEGGTMVQCTEISFKVPPPPPAVMQEDRSCRQTPRSPLQDQKVSAVPPRTLVDNSIPSAYRDERRESRQELRLTIPTQNISRSTEQGHYSGNVFDNDQEHLSSSSSSLKRSRDEDMSDSQLREMSSACVRCYAFDERCYGEPQCRACSKEGLECERKRCKFGLSCRHPKCAYIHPGQWDEKDEAWIVHSGSLPLIGIDKYGLARSRARGRERGYKQR